jgi:epoxyqueuosine reductase
MLEEIWKAFADQGLMVYAADIKHIPELMAEFDALRAEELIDDGRYQYLQRQFGEEEAEAQGMQSVLSVAVPSPVWRVSFRHAGKTLVATIPPTYRDYGRMPPDIEMRLNGVLGKNGYRAKAARKLPEKLLATRCGLAEYGRNNIAYVKGLGSFVFLSSYYTDMPCEDGWRAPKRMEMCDRCTKCADNCPTGALDPQRRIISQDKCLTMHNEADSSVPFPDWISPAAHNSLIGCMACQDVCPANAKRLDFTAGPVEFGEEETAMLLEGKPCCELPRAMAEKMEPLDMQNYIKPVARNLGALFDKYH